MMTRTRLPFVAAGLVCLVAVALAQLPMAGSRPNPNVPKEYGILNFESNVGSFKVLGAGDDLAQGKLEFDFNGTVLISGHKGNLTITGNVRKEYEDKKRERAVYFGKGRIVMDGQYKAVQFFGRDLRGRQNGFGVFRFFGEFDRNLNTGNRWYEGYPKEPWGNGGNTVLNPMPDNMKRVVPKVKMQTGG